MARRIPHCESPTEVRQALQHLGDTFFDESSDVDHDATTNFVVAEHVDHSAVSIIAGTGLSGGGTLEADRTLNVTGTGVDHGALSGLNDDDHPQYLLADGSRNLTGNLAVDTGVTIDGRDLSADGAKLNGIEPLADVTDATNVAAAGAAMSGGAFHDGFSDYAANQHVVLPNIIANVLTDHNLAAHTGLGLFDASSDVDHDATTNTHNLTTDVDHASITNTHNLTTDVDHASITNTHNLTTDIDHDTITNYDANKHVDHTGVTLTAGSGLAGGGDISANRTFDLDINSLAVASIAAGDFVPFWDITATATNKKITFANLEGTLNHDSLASYDANKHVDHTGVSITTAAGSGLSGGGTIASTRTLVLDINGLTGESGIAAADTIPFYDSGVGNRKITFAEFETALGASTDVKVAVDSGATAGYLGAASGDGVLRTGTGISYADGGDFITLTCNPGYVDRGQVAAWDFTLATPLTMDGAYHDLDLSGILPAGAYAAYLRVSIKATAANQMFYLVEKGTTVNYNMVQLATQVAGVTMFGDAYVKVDANRKLEYWGSAGLDQACNIVVRGWLI